MQQESTIPHNSSSDNPNSRDIAPQSKPHKHMDWKGALSTILILIAAPLVAITLTSFVFQTYEVDGPSMETTLQNRDRLIVWKVPQTLARFTNKTYIPKRGEIIVFVRHDLSSTGLADQQLSQADTGDKQLIKRVVGLPGERVVVRDGVITIYNQANPEGFNPDTDGGYQLQRETTGGNVDITVGAGEVFVAGDNRPNSLDSRAFGTIKSQDIVGELALRVFPFNKAKSF